MTVAPPLDHSPIFITARFRSGSTLLWNMFRGLGGYRAFYEPCHPSLIAHIQHTRPMESHRGVQSYWDEYVPLMDDLQRLHQPQFGFERLVLEAQDNWPDLQRYIEFLCGPPGGPPGTCRGVLKFNRMDFRLPWLRAKFPRATIVHLHRSPRESWVSTRRHLPPEQWDDPDCDDAYELWQWSVALAETFPFLVAADVQSSYQRHYFLWRLSGLMGQRLADCSIDFDEELRQNPQRGIDKLINAGALAPQLVPTAMSRIESLEPLDWSKYHTADWFSAVEDRCERVLVDLGLVAHFGLRPLAPIREDYRAQWKICASAPRQPLAWKLLEIDARHRSEETRLLHRVRSLEGARHGEGIIIDARCINNELSGIERYVLGLLEGLGQIGLPCPIQVLGRPVPHLLEVLNRYPDLKLVECDVLPWSLRSQMRLPKLLRTLGCRVYHCPDLYGPFRRQPFATVLTVHDMIPYACRRELRKSWKSRLFPLFHLWLRRQCAQADAIVTVSEFSRRQIVDLDKVHPERVHAIYNGVSLGQPDITAGDFRKRFGIDNRIITYIGRHDPYKNIQTLVQAFERVSQVMNGSVTLVIGGKNDRRYQQPQRTTRQLRLDERVMFTGFLDEPMRIALLRASSVFAFPSKYEGFGLPPLEAMAEGVPVVAANATSLPEVLGDAALLVDPNDPAALADAMVALLQDEALAERMRARGREQAAKFTWKQCAAAHLGLYQQVAQSTSGRK